MKGITCGTVDENNQDLGGNDVEELPTLISQPIALGLGLRLSIPAEDSGGNPADFYQNNFADGNVPVDLPQYAIGQNSKLLTTSRDGSPVEEALSNRVFSREVLKQLQQRGLCPFTHPELAIYRVNAKEFSESMTNTAVGEGWQVRICTNYLSDQFLIDHQESPGPKRYDISGLPSAVQKLFSLSFQSPFPLDPDANGYMPLDVHKSGKLETIILYQRGKLEENMPAIASTTMMYRDAQVADVENMQEPIPAGLVASALVLVMGSGGLIASFTIEYIQKREETENPPKIKKKKTSRLREMPRTVHNAPIENVETTTGGEITETPVYKPFLLKIGSKEIQRDDEFSEDDVIECADALTDDQNVRARVMRSGKEISDLMSLALTTKGDFTKIQALLEFTKKRATAIDIGGDSVVFSYHVIDEQRNILGYLLVEVDLEERQGEVTFFEDVPNREVVTKRKTQIASTTIIEPAEDNKPAVTVEDVAKTIVQKIPSLLNGTLSPEAFRVLGQECAQLIEKNSSYKLVKDEVKRLLVDQINTNQIPIYCDNDKMRAAALKHPRIIADRIYDYMCDAITNENEFMAFTQSAKNMLDRQDLIPLKQTAGKAWETRTEYRIQIVQAQSNEKMRIAVLFTDNNH